MPRKIVSLKINALKQLLRVRNLKSTGNKAELIERLTTALASDEVDYESADEVDDENAVQEQINELRNMMASVLTAMQQQATTNAQIATNVQDTRSDQANKGK